MANVGRGAERALSNKKYRETNRDAILERKRKYREKNREILREKAREYYGLHKEQSKQYRDENKDIRKKYNKQYNIDNRKKIYKKHKQYYKENRKIINKKAYRHKVERYKDDVSYRILRNCRARLRCVMKGNLKTAKSIDLIGCTIKYLMQHLETQFTAGMTWDNYGEWHIDHIVPCSSFDFTKEKEQRECFNFINLQPLWAEDNLKKSDKIYRCEG